MTSYLRLKSGKKEGGLTSGRRSHSFSISHFTRVLPVTSGNGKLASWTSILGFVVMMSLDVGLG